MLRRGYTTAHYGTGQDAEAKQKELSAQLVMGTYASPAAGRVSFGKV
jgi:hypothetical protein